MTLYIRIVVTFLMLLAFFRVQGLENPIQAEVNTADTVPVYVRIIDSPSTPGGFLVDDSVFYEIAGSVIFRVNRTELNPQSPILTEIVEKVVPITLSRHLRLETIELRGAASPEGPYDNNVRLSKGRAQALLDFLSPHLGAEAVSKVKVATTAEDYLNLYFTLRRNGDPAEPVVKEIIDRYGLDDHNSIKSALRAYDDGRLWRRLLRDVFPGLRAARMVLYLTPIKIKEPAPVNPIYMDECFLPATAPVLPLLPQPESRRHMLSVGTNLLYDAMYIPQYGMAPMPNVQLEFYPRSGRYTFAASFTFPYYHRWSKHKFFQLRDYHLEVRRYFNPGEHHTGCYLGVYGNANIYGIGFSATKGWEGEGWGGAIKLGYVLNLGGRWRLDLHAAVGGYVTRYDPYVYGNPITGNYDGDYYYDYTGNIKDFKKRNHRFTWFGPTEVGVTLTWDLLHYKKRTR